MISKIISHVKNSSLFGCDENTHINFIQISNHGDKAFTNAKITYLLFKKNERVPFLVAKAAKDPSNRTSIKNEFDWATRFYSHCDHICPKPIELALIENQLVLFEEYIDDCLISEHLDDYLNIGVVNTNEIENLIEEHFSVVEAIQSKLNQICVESNHDELENELAELFDKYILKYKILDPIEKEYLQNSKRNISKLFKGKKARKRPTNLDLIPGNIMVGTHRFIDIEYCDENHFWEIEFLRFFYYYYYALFDAGLYQHSPNPLSALLNVLKSSNDILYRKFRDHFRDFDLGHENIKSLLLIFFLHEAILQYDIRDFHTIEFRFEWKNFINYLTGYLGSLELINQSSSYIDTLHANIDVLDSAVARLESELRNELEQKVLVTSQLELELERELEQKVLVASQLELIQNSSSFRVIQKLKNNRLIDTVFVSFFRWMRSIGR